MAILSDDLIALFRMFGRWPINQPNDSGVGLMMNDCQLAKVFVERYQYALFTVGGFENR